MTKAKLDKIAGALKVHPRTVLRAVEGDVNAYWAEGHNPDVELIDVALAFSVELDVLKRVLRGKDELFKPQEAAGHISLLENRKVPLRTFRYRKYPIAVKTTGVVRYSRLEISDHHVEHIA